MRRMGRRAFLGAVGLSAAGAATTAVAASDVGGYHTTYRPFASIGIGRGQGASLSVVFLPLDTLDAAPSLAARLVIYELGGKELVAREVKLSPFSGASIEYELPRGARRTHVFG